MSIFSSLNISFHSLNTQKTRTFLAVLGVMIGIASIIVVFSAGEGIYGLVVGEVESFGADTIQVEIKVPTNKKGYASEQQSAINLMQGVQVTTLKVDDLEDILKLPNIKDGYALLMSQEPVRYQDEMSRVAALGVSESFIDIDKSEIDYGRFFSENEDRSLSQLVVLGPKIKDKLFGQSDPIGKTIKIREAVFRVVGVLKERGAVMTMDFDNFIYLPIRTMQKKVMGVDFTYDLILRVNDMSLMDSTAEEMRSILRENHNIAPPQETQEGWADTGKDDFRVMSMMEILDLWGEMAEILTLLLLAIVAVSLVVGGVGVMNVMYVVVNERVAEIGLRKAVGAKYSDILRQFLIESVLITLAGGIVGTLFGIFLSFLLSLGANYFGVDWRFAVPLKAFITAIVFSFAFGILFGLYPAHKAARMDPVEALRHGE